MPEFIRARITRWRVIAAVVFAVGLYSAYLRFFKGWEAATNLSDAQPWGIWVGLATLCGVALSAGGFAIAAAVHLLGMDRYRPIAGAAVLIAFLGYLTVCAGYAYELGRPWQFYNVFFYYNRHSVLFDVCWCILMYTTVLTLEVAPQLLEKLPWAWAKKLPRWQHKKVLLGLTLAGTMLSSMHQSFLGGLFLIMKGHLYPLWYSQYIHTMFYLSAIPSGLCMVIIVSYLSVRSLGVKLDYAILRGLARATVPMLIIYAVFRAVDLATTGGYKYLFKARSETLYFWVEILLLVALPIAGFCIRKVRRTPILLYWTACIEVIGLVANRLNVSITAMEYSTHANYMPKWPEFMLTMAVVAAAIVAFRYAVLYLDVFPNTTVRDAWLKAAGPAPSLAAGD